MPRLKKSTAYKSLYVNPLTELKQERSRNNSSGNLNLHLCGGTAVLCDKENDGLFNENLAKIRPLEGKSPLRKGKRQGRSGFHSRDKIALRSHSRSAPVDTAEASLQVCIQMNEPDSIIGRFKPPMTPNNTQCLHVWDDAEAAPAPSWSTLPNRSLLCRPLPPDIGRCTCFIVRERSEELDHASVYSLYTNEGHGRQDRKLAVARHRRRGGRSEFFIAQSFFGILSKSDEGYLGMVTANLVGSRYHIWDQGNTLDCHEKGSRQLLGVVTFVPTVTTLTGSFRSMRASIPKLQSMQTKNNATQHVSGLPTDWEDNTSKVHQLCSKVPYYNKVSDRIALENAKAQHFIVDGLKCI